MIKYLFIGVLVCWTSIANAADVKSVLAKLKENQKNNLSYAMTYQLFKGHRSTEIHSSYEGEFFSFNGNGYRKVKQSEFILNTKYTLQIDNEQKAMVISSGIPMDQDVDIDLVLKDCSESRLEEKETYYELIFRFNSTSDMPCSVIKFRVNKKDYYLQRLDIYYTTHQDFSVNRKATDLAQPHLRVIYSDVKKMKKDRPELFEISNYVSLTNSTLVPTGTYEGYELIDNRN